MFLPRRILEQKLLSILSEDLGSGDITTEAIVPEDAVSEAKIVTREAGLAAGVEEAKTLLEMLGIRVNVLVPDGEKMEANETMLEMTGNTRTLLSAERTVLNILSRMSGIATTTHSLVEKLEKAKRGTRVACTRKTAPGLLYFDKKAVFLGGGDTHRLHLDDLVLIKDNHIAVASNTAEAVKRARERVSFSKKIEVEVSDVDDVLVAARSGADIIMLDNFSRSQTTKALKLLRGAGLLGDVLVESSGGITAKNVLGYAVEGVDVVSLGELTDSPRALDIHMKITKTRRIQTERRPR